MIFDCIEEIKTSIVMNLGEWMGRFDKQKNGELYYVYAYTLNDVFITRQGSTKVELLEGVTHEFKRNLAEGFILRYADGMFIIDEYLTEKSMNFELDFDNYKE